MPQETHEERLLLVLVVLVVINASRCTSWKAEDHTTSQTVLPEFLNTIQGSRRSNTTYTPPSDLRLYDDARVLKPDETFFGPASHLATYSTTPYKTANIPNVHVMNTSSPPAVSHVPSANTTSAPHSLPTVSSLAPPAVHSPQTRQSRVFKASTPSSSPTLSEISAMQMSPPRNFIVENMSLPEDLTLPNWERAPSTLITRRNFSRVFRVPSWESSLSLFGVKTNDEARISFLHRDSDEAPVNISLYGADGESQIQFNLSSGEEVQVSRRLVTLYSNAHKWFTVFRKEHFVALHIQDFSDPFLAYVHSDKNISFLHYTRFQIWSRERAEWDFVGKSYQNENRGVNPTDEAMKTELDGISEGLAKRFSLLMNLVSVLQLENVVNNLSLEEIQEIKDIKDSVMPLRNLLLYYGSIDRKNAVWTRT